ncbi:hypothetical protein JVT61DRAFT_14896 [Boletus reticuloceps]|uniref:Myosin motor domain-containing protein n=1 Tax=Boletus reticuloceps TaxID=495285 RepID=A0A8I3A284_9AGAM|nr:hypothetical protein JVT61DRAFT_14896 [Boletus reticuloceps]
MAPLESLPTSSSSPTITSPIRPNTNISLKMALKSVGLSKRHVAQTCQLVAAILHLGNMEFTIDCGRDVDAAVVRNVDVPDIVAKFLGVQPSALETTLA